MRYPFTLLVKSRRTGGIHTLKTVNAVNRVLRKIELYVGALLIGIIFVLTSINIILRYFFSSPIIWAEEVVRFAFIWLGYLTINYTLSFDGHVRFSMILDAIKGKARVIVYIVLDVLIAAVILVLFPSMLRSFRFLVKTPALMVSEVYFFLIVPIGYSLMIIHTSLNIFRRLNPATFSINPPFQDTYEEVKSIEKKEDKR